MTPISTVTCPRCGATDALEMPTDACLWFHQCTTCGAVLRPRPGDCCVVCSYGTTACPPAQAGGACGGS